MDSSMEEVRSRSDEEAKRERVRAQVRVSNLILIKGWGQLELLQPWTF